MGYRLTEASGQYGFEPLTESITNPLTEYEVNHLEKVAQGYSFDAIANMDHVNLHSVMNRHNAIVSLLQVQQDTEAGSKRSRLPLMRTLIEKGLIDPRKMIRENYAGPKEKLSDEEFAMLGARLAGSSRRQIAKNMGIALEAVDTILKEAQEKLGVQEDDVLGKETQTFGIFVNALLARIDLTADPVGGERFRNYQLPSDYIVLTPRDKVVKETPKNAYIIDPSSEQDYIGVLDILGDGGAMLLSYKGNNLNVALLEDPTHVIAFKREAYRELYAYAQSLTQNPAIFAITRATSFEDTVRAQRIGSDLVTTYLLDGGKVFSGDQIEVFQRLLSHLPYSVAVPDSVLKLLPANFKDPRFPQQ